MLPQPGCAAYIPTLLTHLSTLPHLPTPDPEIFAAILLNLIVNRGGLIIDIPEGSSPKEKRRLNNHVVAISEIIFGRSTRVINLDPGVEPSDIGELLLEKSAATAPSAVDTEDIVAPSRGRDEPEIGELGDEDGVQLAEPDLKIAETIILNGVENLNGPALLQLNDILVKKSLMVYPQSQPSKRMKQVQKIALPPTFLLIWIRTDPLVHRDTAPGWWIDQFLSNIYIYPSDLPPSLSTFAHTSIPLPRSHPSDHHTHNQISTTTNDEPPIPPEYISRMRALLDYTHIHPPLSIYINNLFSAVSSHPLLFPTITARAVRSFPLFVKAHRLLSGQFSLPNGWEEALRRREQEFRDRGEGKCGEGNDIWSRLAGEEPTVRSLMITCEGGGEGEEGEEIAQWYATDENVKGVWSLCLRHRVTVRKPQGGIMWLVNSSAADSKIEKDASKKKVKKVESILDEIIQRL